MKELLIKRGAPMAPDNKKKPNHKPPIKNRRNEPLS